MCRSIKTLANYEPPATNDEVQAAALQYVRKITGTTKPSEANQAAFDQAVSQIAMVSRELLTGWQTNAKPKNREEEAAKAIARAAKRYG